MVNYKDFLENLEHHCEIQINDLTQGSSTFFVKERNSERKN
jgi:hypothetical protein